MFLRNYCNSCYIDTLITIFHFILTKEEIEQILKNELDDLCPLVRMAIVDQDIKTLRHCFYTISKNSDWLHKQQEPYDVILMLKTLFEFEKNVAYQEKIYAMKSTEPKLYIIKNDDSMYDFCSTLINTNIDYKLSVSEHDFIKFDNHELYKKKYSRLLKVKTLMNSKSKILMMHVNRNNFGSKLQHKISIPNNLLNFELRAIIVHKGNNVNFGHYVAYLKDHKQQWFIYDDLLDDLVLYGKDLDESIYKNCTDIFYSN